jgi:hypothetical protein
MKHAAMILGLFFFTVSAGNGSFTVAFIGLTPGGAPAFEESFGRHLQEKFATTQDVNTVDYTVIQKLRGKINFQNLTTISPQTLETLRRFYSDSTVFIWGTVDRYSVRNARAGLLHAQVSAEATIRIIIYSFSERNYTFSDKIVCSANKPSGWLFFHPFTASSKVSAPDFSAALDLLEKEAVDKSFTLVNKIIKTEIMNQRRNQRTAGTKTSNPAISDLFNVPSVEAASLDGTNGNDSTASMQNSPAAVQNKPAPAAAAGSAKPGKTDAAKLKK